jgi:hypothetical protein
MAFIPQLTNDSQASFKNRIDGLSSVVLDAKLFSLVNPAARALDAKLFSLVNPAAHALDAKLFSLVNPAARNYLTTSKQTMYLPLERLPLTSS